MNKVGVGLQVLAAVVSVRTAFAAPQFKENLWRMIREVRARHATPFLATPIVRLTYRDGHLVDSAHLDDWAQRMREVAHEANVTLVDMRKLTYKAADEAGEAEALTWNAKGDRTHPAAKGARLYADLFHRDVTSRKLEIGKIFVDPRPVCCKGKTPSFTMRKVPAMTMDESLRARFGEEKTDE